MSIAARRLSRSAASAGDITYDANGRPSGPGFVRYEDLYVSGDTVTDALRRLSTPAIVTFPPGKFMLSGFPYYGGAIDVPKAQNCLGIIGSGRGTLGGNTGTIFQMIPGTSSFVTGTSPETPAQAQGGTTQVWVMRCVGTLGSVRFENFQIVGAAEGHNFGGLYVYHPRGDTTIRNVLVCGTEGNNGAPPGETFAISVYQGNMGKILIEDCEVDGRRVIGGEWFAAGGITCGQSIGAVVNRCTAHHQRASSPFVFYRSFDGTLNDCVWGTTDPLQTSLSNVRPVSEVNQEVASGIVHNNCTYNHCTPNRMTHITHSNNHMVCQYTDWSPRSCANGTLKVVNPTYNDIWGDNRLYISSWITGVDGTTNDDSMTTPPLVTQSDGVTHIPYVWSHNTNTVIY